MLLTVTQQRISNIKKKRENHYAKSIKFNKKTLKTRKKTMSNGYVTRKPNIADLTIETSNDKLYQCARQEAYPIF